MPGQPWRSPLEIASPRFRARRLPAGSIAALAVVLALGAMPARAQTVDLQQFKAAPGEGAFLGLHGARSLVHLQVQAGLVLNFGNAPLVLRTPTTGAVSTAVVAHQTTADLTVAVGLFELGEIGLALPITLQGSNPAPVLGETFQNGLFPAGLGDLRLVPKVTLLDTGTFRLGLAATITLPTGSGEALMGSSSFGARPRVLVEYDVLPGTRVALNAGANLRPEARLLNLTVGSELAYALAAESQLPVEGLTVGGGLSGALGLSELQAEELPVELLVEGRYLVSPGLTASLGGGFGLSRGYGTPAFRVLAGVTWAQAAERPARAIAVAPPPPPSSPADTDRDGIPDEKDRCPREAETRNGHQDDDGCPDQVAPVRLEMPPPPVGFSEKTGNGSPPPPPPPPPPVKKTAKDADGDSVPDDLDLCPEDPGDGNASGDGCPPDADSDGIPDARDACPDKPETINDFEEEDGCPDKAPGSRKVKKGKRRR